MNAKHETNWPLGTDLIERQITISSGISSTVAHLVDDQLPELADLFPLRHGSKLEVHFDDGWLALSIVDAGGAGGRSVGRLKGQKLNELRSQVPATFQPEKPEALRNRLGVEWYSFKKFTYIGPWLEPNASWSHIEEHLISWLNDIVAPEVERRNMARVVRALPPSPQFNVDRIRPNLWILECEESMSQGTAFTLTDVGVVTCAHVLGPRTQAFKYDAINDKRAVTVLMRNHELDLAVIKIEGSEKDGLPSGSADDLTELQHLAVSGFPNYNLGDSGIFTPCLVVGFRVRSGIRQILTNGPIVAGMSGGPAINGAHEVIGVAVTGADRMEGAQETEKHGIIPINALRYLRA